VRRLPSSPRPRRLASRAAAGPRLGAMDAPDRAEATRLLRSLADGDAGAADLLFPLIYEDLRRLAESYLRRERAGHTLQPTALVHEAYVRLVNAEGLQVADRAHFFRLAARAMRNLLVDHARRRNAQKRGADPVLRTSSALDRVGVWDEARLLELHDALETLAAQDARKAQLVEMRFFGGLTIEEAAAALGIGHATAERDWAFAKAYLLRELGPDHA
jgi:RNA polymerase sigma-70 factor (ECF subfamily)